MDRQNEGVNVETIQHVAVVVESMAAARPFYEEVLGLRPVARPDFGIAGEWYGVGAVQLHLAEVPGVASHGPAHFALQVSDLDAAVAHLESHGVEVRRSDHVPGAGRQAFVNDPSGNLIELNQPDQ